MKIDEPKTFDQILKRKIDYYGETRAAYLFATEEYARSVIQSELLRIAGDAFEAAREGTGGYRTDTEYVPFEPTYPDKEEYLRTLSSEGK